MAGPMARNVSDLTFAAEGMYSIARQKRDEGYMMRQRVLPIPWRKVELPRKMKIGYFIEEGSVKVCHPNPRIDFGGSSNVQWMWAWADVQTSPACRRAVETCVNKLREAGHEVELFEPPPRTSLFLAWAVLIVSYRDLQGD
jgi:Asp-tRNA(Asn)/Glu-tRNA(Gln) amidotransferase A subunit family amidase